MGTASFQLLAFASVAAIAYNLFGSLRWRQAVLLVANAYFLYTFVSSLQSILPAVAFLILGYAGVRAMQKTASAWVYVAILVAVVGSFIWLKKYTFLPSGTFLPFAYVTIGLSYILFRVLHLIIDAHANSLQEKIDPISYLNYTLSFMTLVSGPIQRYENFAKTGRATIPQRLTLTVAGEGLHRIAVGFFKVAVLSLLFFRLQKHALEALGPSQPISHRALTVAVVAVSYAFFLYFNFSGYIDLVIGIGRFFGFRLPENFDHPFFADNFMNFWNRWHITLSDWFKTYVFNPLLLASMRRTASVKLQSFLAVPAIFVTFFLVGVWHGRTSEFLFFGFLQGFGLAANLLYRILLEKQLGRKRYQVLAANPVYAAFSRGLTFTWLTFTLFWFWSNWGQLREIALTLGGRGVLLFFPAVLLPASVLLSLVEVMRGRALAVRWKGSAVLLSPYTLTVFDTSLSIASFVVVVLLHHAASANIYKAF